MSPRSTWARRAGGSCSAEVGPDQLRPDRGRTASTTCRSDRLGTLHWDILRLYRGVLDGPAPGRPGPAVWTRSASTRGRSTTDCSTRDGRAARQPGALPRPAHRRRHGAGAGRAVGEQSVYATTGLQNLPFNTIYQLVAPRTGPALRGRRERLLLIPDLLSYWLTGAIGAELTNASTTQLLDVRTGTWAADLIARLGLPERPVPAAAPAGRPHRSAADPTCRRDRACGPVPVTAVGSHDTASAVVGVPAGSEDASPTSPAAPGRWSASSWTRRCSPRRAGGPTSPTSSASTARSATCAT